MTTLTAPSALAEFATIDLESLLAYADLQTRVDRKYLLTPQELDRMLDGLDAAVLTIGARQEFDYHSVYFDTPDRDSYLLAGRARRRRFKVRTRSYRDSGLSWLEVKTRGPRGTTVKDRLDYRMEDADRLTEPGGEFVETSLALRQVGGIDVRRLRPSLTSSFVRTTLLLAEESIPARATIDRAVRWQRPGATTGLAVADRVILETKSSARPTSLDRRLWAAGIRPSRISKYGAGLAALDPTLPELKWHHLLTTLPLAAA